MPRGRHKIFCHNQRSDVNATEGDPTVFIHIVCVKHFISPPRFMFTIGRWVEARQSRATNIDINPKWDAGSTVRACYRYSTMLTYCRFTLHMMRANHSYTALVK